MAQQPIRVVICDDSAVAREMLSQILSSDPEIEVVGQARDGQEAVETIARLKPDLATMDIHMPKMDGVEAVAQIMAYNPVPILVVSSSVRGPGIGYAFEALKAGALEVIKKPEPRDWQDLERIASDIIRRVKTLSHIPVITHIAARRTAEAHGRGTAGHVSAAEHDFALAAMGSSTGGPSALMSILSVLPREFPVPIVVAQHIADGFVPGLVDWLRSGCRIAIDAAQDGEDVRPGHVYLAPTGQNLVLEGTALKYERPGPGQLYIPSADTLFESVARTLRRRAIGVILTGMGNDGAAGLKTMHDAGATTIAQNERTSIVYGMPRAAVEMGAASAVLPLSAIGYEVLRLVQQT